MNDIVVNFDQYKSQVDIQERFFLEITPIIINEEITDFIHIFQVQKNGFARLTDYSNYFIARVLGESLTNSATNTKVNAHGKFIVAFLNYIFYESENKITTIEELDRKLILEFLAKYAQGLTENQRGIWVSKETSLRAGRAVMRFVYWLKYSYNNRTTGAKINMHKIKQADFDITTKIKRKKRIHKDGSVSQEDFLTKVIECPSDFKKTSKNSGKNHNREKVIQPGLYTIKTLIDVAKRDDQLMIFPIILGAFVGLRQGDVVQMSRERINLPDIEELIKGGRIDLWDEAQISNNPKDSGRIKTHRIQPIYEAFMPIIIQAYEHHLNLLKSRDLDNHKYGAIFFNNRNDDVMKQTSLNRRFNTIADEAISILRTESLEKDNEYAITEYNIISDSKYKLRFHSLRYFYTQMIEELEVEPFTIAYYRGDSCVESQNTYRGNMSTISSLKLVLDKMEALYEEYGLKI